MKTFKNFYKKWVRIEINTAERHYDVEYIVSNSYFPLVNVDYKTCQSSIDIDFRNKKKGIKYIECNIRN